MSEQTIYTEETLEALTLEQLQEVHKSLGMEPGDKKEKRLRKDILEAQTDASTSVQPDKNAATPATETPAAPEVPAAPVAQDGKALNVNKHSSRIQLEEAGLALGLDAKKLAEAGSHEDLWRMVKNAHIAKHTAVNVDEDTEGGDLMKVTVKHSGNLYEKGKRYELGEALREEFRTKFYI